MTEAEQPILYKGKFWKVKLLDDQYYLGRCVVVLFDKSKRKLSDLNQEEFSELLEIIKLFESAITKVFGADMFNWSCLMNNSYKPENTDAPDPIHFHVRPRYSKQVVIGDTKFVDEDFGHHYSREHKTIVGSDLLAEIESRIKKAF